MNPSEPLLQKLNDWRPAGAGRHVLTVTDPASGWTTIVAADQVENTGLRLWELTLRRGRPAPAGVTLGGWAERLAARATGLLEALAVHEVDVTRGEALLRSKEPTHRANQLAYYEVLLQGTSSACLRRYEAIAASGSASPHRRQVSFALTLESLAKLVDDLAAE